MWRRARGSRRRPEDDPGHLPKDVAETAEAFGWQWQTFTDQLETFREELLEWLAPVTADQFRGKVVLDAGCGKGRHLLLAADFGAAQAVGLDLSSAVDVARQHTEHLPVVDVVQGNLLAPPLGPGTFDLIYSIGVIHHVPEPAQRRCIACPLPEAGRHVARLGLRLRGQHAGARGSSIRCGGCWRAGCLGRACAPERYPAGIVLAGVARASRRLAWLPMPAVPRVSAASSAPSRSPTSGRSSTTS